MIALLKELWAIIGPPIRTVSVVQWRKIDADWLDQDGGRKYVWRPLLVLALVAVSLTLQQYWGLRDEYWELFPERRT